jgi:hypothetical protein
MQAVASDTRRLITGEAVKLLDGTDGVYIGPIGGGKHQIDTATGTRFVSRFEFDLPDLAAEVRELRAENEVLREDNRRLIDIIARITGESKR